MKIYIALGFGVAVGGLINEYADFPMTLIWAALSGFAFGIVEAMVDRRRRA